VPEVVKQRAGATHNASFRADWVMRSQERKRASHHVHYAQRMSEPAVLGALICEHREPELFDAAQPLKFQ
jgi:hypothetical protein